MRASRFSSEKRKISQTQQTSIALHHMATINVCQTLVIYTARKSESPPHVATVGECRRAEGRVLCVIVILLHCRTYWLFTLDLAHCERQPPAPPAHLPPTCTWPRAYQKWSIVFFFCFCSDSYLSMAVMSERRTSQARPPPHLPRPCPCSCPALDIDSFVKGTRPGLGFGNLTTCH